MTNTATLITAHHLILRVIGPLADATARRAHAPIFISLRADALPVCRVCTFQG
jgi:hypothetical protein